MEIGMQCFFTTQSNWDMIVTKWLDWDMAIFFEEGIELINHVINFYKN